jgi:catechol 2,3-dioxygenase-like lactoylglutathione lyase family enzyme
VTVAFVCKYLALYVPDLRAAEDFYRRVFGVDVLFRETEREGEWWTLPAATAWDEAVAAGIEVGMVALRRESFVLALFPGRPQRGAVYEVSIGLGADEIDGLRAHPPDGLHLLEHSNRFMRFDDPFGFRWVLQPSDAEFRSSGEIAGRWLDV